MLTQQQKAFIDMVTFKLLMILSRQHSLMHRILEEAGIDASYFTSGRAERYREAQCELAKAELEANLDLVNAFLQAGQAPAKVAASFHDGIGDAAEALPAFEIID